LGVVPPPAAEERPAARPEEHGRDPDGVPPDLGRDVLGERHARQVEHRVAPAQGQGAGPHAGLEVERQGLTVVAERELGRVERVAVPLPVGRVGHDEAARPVVLVELEPEGAGPVVHSHDAVLELRLEESGDLDERREKSRREGPRAVGRK
ncbi:hypothetical protein THAOC_23701, partial [Thalassiosira oceanica]